MSSTYYKKIEAAMSEVDYAEFDKTLFAMLDQGPHPSWQLQASNSPLPKLLMPLRPRNHAGNLEHVNRVMDRRLRILERRGSIGFSGNFWYRR